jgi:AraC-like DNA-binding protein
MIVYLLAAIVAGIVLNMLFYYRRISNLYLEEVRTLGAYQIERIVQAHDQRINTLLESGTALAFADYSMEELADDFKPDYFHRTSLMRKLENLLTRHREIRSAYIFLDGVRTVVSTETGMFYQDVDFYHQSVFDEIRSSTRRMVLSRQYQIDLFGTRRTYMSLSLKFPQDDYFGILVLNIDMDALYANLASEFSIRGSRRLTVGNVSGDTLFDNMPTAAAGNPAAVTISRESSLFGQTFTLTILPTEIELSRTRTFLRASIESFLVFAGVAAVLSLIFLRTLSPLTQLLNRVAREQAGDEEMSIAALSRYLSALRDEAIELRGQYDRMLPIYRDRFLVDLLLGNIEEELIETRCRDNGIQLRYGRYAAMCVHLQVYDLKDRETSIIKTRLKELVERRLVRANGLSGYAVDVSRHEIGVLLSFQDEDGLSVLRDFSEKLIAGVRGEVRDNIFVGIGSISEELKEIADSYAKALKTLDYQRVADSPVLSIYEILGSAGSMYEFPYAKEKAMLSYLRDGNTAECLAVVDEIIEGSIRHNLDRWEMDYLFMQLLDTLNRYVYEHRLSIGEGRSFHTSFDIVNSESMDTIRSLFSVVISDIIDAKENRRLVPDGVVSRIIQYVYDHHGSKTLQLMDLEEVFNLNRYYLSHLFKSETGQYFNDFLHDVRITKAEELLDSTGGSIKSIADTVGYAYTYYFIRQFKKRHGITPKEYRDRKLITRR